MLILVLDECRAMTPGGPARAHDPAREAR